MTLTTLTRLFRRRPPYASARHLWAVAKATSADGVTARVGVEFTLEVLLVDGGSSEELEDSAIDAVEGVLRREIGRRSVASLPTVGAPVDWVPPDLVPGARLANAFVLSSDLEVTRQLQRLVVEDASH
jgi:hypothetical protein